jgi:putative membrane protein insertion efficiency factor
MKLLIIKIITFYQILASPILKQLFGDSCRFNPTCSVYMKQSIMKYGIIKGSQLGIRQLLSCHPWGKI